MEITVAVSNKIVSTHESNQDVIYSKKNTTCDPLSCNKLQNYKNSTKKTAYKTLIKALPV